jgi:hypothetical protein
MMFDANRMSGVTIGYKIRARKKAVLLILHSAKGEGTVLCRYQETGARVRINANARIDRSEHPECRYLHHQDEPP